MRSSIVKSRRARVAALAIGAAVLAPLTAAAPSFALNPGVATPAAGQPLAGANCQSDGKISGRGSTLQLWLQYDLASAYSNDVCGASPLASAGSSFADSNISGALADPTDPASPLQKTNSTGQAGQNWQIAYNDYSAQASSATGSGNGKTAISCRTDAFGGTDIPYVTADWNSINGAPGAESGTANKACNPTKSGDTYTSPFEASNAATLSTDPQGSAGTGVMSVPIGGSAVELAANLTKASCGDSTNPATLKLTALDVSNIMGGVDTNWENLDQNVNGANDLGENPTLAACNEAIVRVVRNDDSGTTQALLNYLKDAAASDATCTPSNGTNGTWTLMQNDVVTTGHNNLWPGEDGTPGSPAADTVWPLVSTNTGCSGVTQQGGSGGPNLLSILHNQPGGVGYADVSDIKHDTSSALTGGTYLATLIGSTVANYATGAFTAPLKTATGASNCSFSAAALPGSSTADYVGLFGDYALDNSLNTDDVSNAAQGSSYPICTLTWDFVWGGEDGNTAGVAPQPELNADQVRTLYSYFTYVLSDPAQATEAAAGYAPLPESFITNLRAAFQQYF